LGLQLSGAAEASFTQNFNNPSTNVNSLRVFDTQANSFVPQVAQFMVERPATDASALDRIGFRARVNYGAQSRFSRARTNYQPGTDNTELDVHELYGEYIVPVGNGLKIQFGKINTLIGLEVINSWENPNWSRSWTFGLAQAFTETGVRFTYPFTSWATMAVGLVNGWDNIEDNNKGKTIQLYFFTTLELAPEQIAQLYGYRWNIETDLRSLKQTLHLHSLTSRSVDMVAKELVLGVAAYNLVRGAMFAAARLAGIDPRQLSFSRVQDIVNAFLPNLMSAASPEIYQRELDRMLRRAAQCKLSRRPQRPTYPRAVWRRSSRYPKRKDP